MIPRRLVMITIGATALPIILPNPVRYAWAESGAQAVSFVKDTADRLVAIINSTGVQERRRRVQQVLDSAVDVDDIGRFCLGRFWAIATPDQQRRYMALFHEVLASEIAGHLGDYRGVRVTMGLARASADTEIVITKVDRPGKPLGQIDWVVSTATGGPRIVDLLSEGVSMRLSQSEQFTAYLARHQYNIDDLIEALRQNVAQNR
jgi:phospholipid transport system substrate-binding protein